MNKAEAETGTQMTNETKKNCCCLGWAKGAFKVMNLTKAYYVRHVSS